MQMYKMRVAVVNKVCVIQQGSVCTLFMYVAYLP